MRIKTLLVAGAAVLAFSAQAADTEDEKVFYYLGTVISSNLDVLNLSEQEKAQVVAGFSEGLAGIAEELDNQVYSERVQTLTQQRMIEAAEREQAVSQAYLAEKAAEEGAVQTESGLVYREIKAGDGEQPLATSTVTAHYHGTLRDGSVFDSSVDRGEPLTIGLGQVIPCWTEGIAKMKVGGKAQITCPPETAYGPRGQGAIPPNAALTFDVELLAVE